MGATLLQKPAFQTSSNAKTIKDKQKYSKARTSCSHGISFLLDIHPHDHPLVKQDSDTRLNQRSTDLFVNRYYYYTKAVQAVQDICQRWAWCEAPPSVRSCSTDLIGGIWQLRVLAAYRPARCAAKSRPRSACISCRVSQRYSFVFIWLTSMTDGRASGSLQRGSLTLTAEPFFAVAALIPWKKNHLHAYSSHFCISNLKTYLYVNVWRWLMEVMVSGL